MSMALESVGGIAGLILQATVVVKVILGILTVMSFISWTIIFYKLLLFSKVKKEIERDMTSFRGAEDIISAVKILKGRGESILYRLSIDALGEIKQVEKASLPLHIRGAVARENVQRVLKNGISKSLHELTSALGFLATCANSAPFIGLFGTVWGIMHSFHSIALQKSASLASVAPGIAEALIATAFGLAVAIPASIAFNGFMGSLEGVENSLRGFEGLFLNRAEREIPIFNPSRETSRG